MEDTDCIYSGMQLTLSCWPNPSGAMLASVALRRYETQLAAERDGSQRLKAENVVLQRRMGDVQAKMETVRAEAAFLSSQKAGLQDVRLAFNHDCTCSEASKNACAS